MLDTKTWKYKGPDHGHSVLPQVGETWRHQQTWRLGTVFKLNPDPAATHVQLMFRDDNTEPSYEWRRISAFEHVVKYQVMRIATT